MISIVVPAFNAASTLSEQLGALAAQSAEADWEVIVADNGSADTTVDLVESWMDRIPLRLVDASARPGPAAARNIGASAAVGDVLGFTDADDVVQPGWLAALAEFGHTSGIATGPITRFERGGPPRNRTDRGGGPPRHMGFLPYAFGTNTVITRDTFDRVGGFSEQLHAGEDVDLAWRLQCRGEQLSFLPSAAVAVRIRRRPTAVFGQYFNYGRGDVQLYERYRSQGCPRPSGAPTIKSYAGLVARLPLLPDPVQRVRWLRQFGRRAGRIVGSVECRVVYP